MHWQPGYREFVSRRNKIGVARLAVWSEFVTVLMRLLSHVQTAAVYATRHMLANY
jgi:hypothetical protein